MAFMSAFDLAGQSTKETDRKGVFEYILHQPAGKIILSIITAGLLAYSRVAS
jgi:hypothetical protein